MACVRESRAEVLPWRSRRCRAHQLVPEPESAVRMTGLTDFGADDYSDGLAVLLESYESDLRRLLHAARNLARRTMLSIQRIIQTTHRCAVDLS